MHLPLAQPLLRLLALPAAALAAIGDLCNTGSSGYGTCETKSWCRSKGGTAHPDFCLSDPTDVECCVDPVCLNEQTAVGVCGLEGHYDCPGSYQPYVSCPLFFFFFLSLGASTLSVFLVSSSCPTCVFGLLREGMARRVLHANFGVVCLLQRPLSGTLELRGEKVLQRVVTSRETACGLTRLASPSAAFTSSIEAPERVDE
jgi:hypothetical protein